MKIQIMTLVDGRMCYAIRLVGLVGSGTCIPPSACCRYKPLGVFYSRGHHLAGGPALMGIPHSVASLPLGDGPVLP